MNQLEGNKSLQEREFMWFSKKIKEITQEIEKPLGWILKYETNTNGNKINTSFFSEGLEKVESKHIENTTLFLNSYTNKIQRIKEDVNLSTFLNDVQKNIFLWTLEAYKLKIELFKYATIIEAEKGGYKVEKQEKIEILKKIEDIEEIVYGKKISEQPEEVADIIKQIDNTFKKNKEKISEEDQMIFQDFIKKFSKWENNKEVKKAKEKDTRFGSLNQETFAKVLKKWLEIYNISGAVIKITDKYRDTDGKVKKLDEIREINDVLYIPTINKDTDKKHTKDELEEIYIRYNIRSDSIKIKINECPNLEVSIPEKEINIPSTTNYYPTIRSLELLSHEIVTHAYTWVNKQTKFNIESDTYLELQEGVAMLNEKAVSNNIDNISSDPTIHHISTFIAENYNTEKTEILLGIYYKLQGKKNRQKLAKDRTERVKRFHSNDLPGANRKDVVYRRGMLDVLQYIQSIKPEDEEAIKDLKNNIFWFYIGKLGKSEVTNPEKLIEWFDINKSNIILPADIGKILLWMLEKQTPEGKWIKITNENLGKNDIRFKASSEEQNLNKDQRKLLIEMRNLISNWIEIAKQQKEIELEEKEAALKEKMEKEKISNSLESTT